MAQWLRALTVLPKDLSSVPSNQPHSGSQPSVMRSDAVFWWSEDSNSVYSYT